MVKLHKKPTQEELDEQIKRAIKDGDTPSASPSPSKQVSESPSLSTSPSPSLSQSPSLSESPSVSASPSPSKPDYKEKFKSVSKENIVHFSKRKSLQQAAEDAANVKEPTDEEMTTAHGYSKEDWETMTDFERKMAKKDIVNTKKSDIFFKAVQEGKDLDTWHEKITKFITDPKTLSKFSSLEGKEGEFMEFASKPTRRGVDLEDLVAAFLFDATKSEPKKKKGEMFPKGSGGRNEKSKNKSGKITLEQAERLMKTDYKKYKFYLKNNLIDYSV